MPLTVRSEKIDKSQEIVDEDECLELFYCLPAEQTIALRMCKFWYPNIINCVAHSAEC